MPWRATTCSLPSPRLGAEIPAVLSHGPIINGKKSKNRSRITAARYSAEETDRKENVMALKILNTMALTLLAALVAGGLFCTTPSPSRKSISPLGDRPIRRE